MKLTGIKRMSFGDKVDFQGSNDHEIYCIHPKKKMFMVKNNGRILYQEDYRWSASKGVWEFYKDNDRKRAKKDGWTFPKCECECQDD